VDGLQLAHEFRGCLGYRAGPLNYLAAATFGLCLLGISAVGQEIDRPARDNRPGIITLELGHISDIGRFGQHETINLFPIQMPPYGCDAHLRYHLFLAHRFTLSKRHTVDYICVLLLLPSI
jgi:hypothetical protein